MVRCPVCGKAELLREKRHAEQYGFDLGVYAAEVCPSCGEVFWDKKSVLRMEQKAKKLGIWGLEHRTKIAVVGNSLAVRIPKRIANFLGLRQGVEVLVHPVGKGRLVVEGTGKET
jgi:YgiT-type zinc finger domain-containing protein